MSDKFLASKNSDLNIKDQKIRDFMRFASARYNIKTGGKTIGKLMKEIVAKMIEEGYKPK